MQIYAIFTVFMWLMTSFVMSISAFAQNTPADPQAVQRLRDGIADDQARLKRLQKESAYGESSERLRLSEQEARALKLPDGRLVFAGPDNSYVDQNGRKLSRAEIARLPKREPSYSSMNAGVVLERMNPDQLAGFVQGLGQMLFYRLAQEDKIEQAVCIQT